MEKRFVVDSMLGKLAKWLRILGLDTTCDLLQDRQKIEDYRSRGYFLITRRKRWCSLPGVLCITEDDPMRQLSEVVAGVPLTRQEVRLLHRCILCNGALEGFPHDLAFGLVPDYVFETAAGFYRCAGCRKIYWPGSHPKRMMERLRQELGWAF